MQSQSRITEAGSFKRFQKYILFKWEALPQNQQKYAKKAWGVLTYKWKWQIAMNIPYLAIFALDRTVPAVHKFDINLLSTVTSNLPLPDFISTWIGLS